MVLTRRLVATCLLAGTAMAALSGCNTSALTKQELVVYFQPGTTTAQKLTALNNCKHSTPAAVAEPIDHSGLPSDQIGDIRFRIDHADDKQVSVLEDCLHKQVGIEGVQIPDLTD
jgi:hypothetical protein